MSFRCLRLARVRRRCCRARARQGAAAPRTPQLALDAPCAGRAELLRDQGADCCTGVLWYRFPAIIAKLVPSEAGLSTLGQLLFRRSARSLGAVTPSEAHDRHQQRGPAHPSEAGRRVQRLARVDASVASIGRNSVLACSLRARSRARRPRLGREAPCGCGRLRALPCPSLRAPAKKGRGRWAEGAAGGVSELGCRGYAAATSGTERRLGS